MRLPFRLVYSDNYFLPIGQHVFPAQKYRMIHDRLVSSHEADEDDFIAPQPASDDDVRLVHGADYVDRLLHGELSPQEELQMELPYSPELVKAFWLSAGGSILAAQRALEDGVCVNIGGGFHHAHPDHGEGFCMIHDVAIAIRKMQRLNRIRRAMTVDCDVHDGNGTAAIFPPKHRGGGPLPSVSGAQVRSRVAEEGSESDGEVFTISLHQANNYPAYKPPSSIDVNLPDGVGDEEYLAWLDQSLSSGLRSFTPDLLCYIAGADPYREDQLGGLALTINGLKERDHLVFQVARARGIPVMITYAGGYARNVQDTVTIHVNTILAAKEIWRGEA
ncbi:MAG TPA: histone deacetylase [Terriglobales bacterium]|nr:histone deacetylase [Terriglobales bacterium]